MSLDELEHTVLLIAAQGESMIPIGQWREPVLALARRGLMSKADDVNYFITEAGRQLIQAEEKKQDQQLGQLLTQATQHRNAEYSAQQLGFVAVDALISMARAAAITEGGSLTEAIRRCSDSVLTTALQKVQTGG